MVSFIAAPSFLLSYYLWRTQAGRKSEFFQIVVGEMIMNPAVTRLKMEMQFDFSIIACTVDVYRYKTIESI